MLPILKVIIIIFSLQHDVRCQKHNEQYHKTKNRRKTRLTLGMPCCRMEPEVCRQETQFRSSWVSSKRLPWVATCSSYRQNQQTFVTNEHRQCTSVSQLEQTSFDKQQLTILQN